MNAKHADARRDYAAEEREAFALATIQGTPTFGLPGNPVSSMVSYEIFVRPALLKMMGHRRIY